MQTENPKIDTVDNNNISKMSSTSHKKKKRKRNKVFWSEREEKTLFILQMALGTKFSIIKTFLKNKSVNDIKNHFYSKLRTYLSIQLAKLSTENFFKNIDKKNYTIKQVLSLVLTNKIPTMILNKNVIKELILKAEQQKKKKAKNKNKEDDDDDLNLKDNKKNKEEVKLKRKRGRPKGMKKKKEDDNVNNGSGNEQQGEDKELQLIEDIIFDKKEEKDNLDLKEKSNQEEENKFNVAIELNK